MYNVFKVKLKYIRWWRDDWWIHLMNSFSPRQRWNWSLKFFCMKYFLFFPWLRSLSIFTCMNLNYMKFQMSFIFHSLFFLIINYFILFHYIVIIILPDYYYYYYYWYFFTFIIFITIIFYISSFLLLKVSKKEAEQWNEMAEVAKNIIIITAQFINQTINKALKWCFWTLDYEGSN